VKPRILPIQVVFGVLFAAGWIIAHFIWGVMTFVANVMSAAAYNPEGQTTNTETGMLLISVMIIGQIVAGLAGIPGGAAFFWPGRKKRLLMLFAGLFVTGSIIQVGIFIYFVLS